MSDDNLINTLERAGEFDALSTLRPDEPYFVLCGRDRSAPALVQQWADERRKKVMAEFEEGKISKDERDLEMRKATQAEAIGWAMTAYKAGHKAKKVIERERATYTGHELPEETKRRDAVFSAKVRISTALGEAEALLEDLRELDSVAFNELCTVAQCGPRDLRRLAYEVAPKRPGIEHPAMVEA